ncbi:polysaccharide biosynthesis tyrosine autokinase [Ancylomarina sp. 16SWW S1-10-2]|uniref:polysaccharide biosynthesis tyrosine autokinase n=1 Tax=Ancylomarina sp. 16SWW S1-10-2 TaxID=2499681 RepID=UPI0012AE8B94|nr:polysaccharide biosynthesis tyrosine autokinase [Ancylomarina sp. 16SWW S1-10-2]MRT93463.1 polysaccharide biosynthesis tyrosine autokinase [Ancylomarina sp. 16SWW S1-10-2]
MYQSTNKDNPVNNDVFSLGNMTKPEKPNIKKWIYLFLKKWYWFVICVFIGLIVAFFINKNTTPVYLVNSTVLIKSESKGYLAEEMSMMSGFSTPDMQNFENQVVLLKTESQILQTLNQLDFNVSYFSRNSIDIHGYDTDNIFKVVKRFLFSTGQNGIQEFYSDKPFNVILDPTQAQLIGVEFHIRKNEFGELRLTAKGENLIAHNFFKGEDVDFVPNINLDESLELDKVIVGQNFGFTIESLSPDFEELLDDNDFFFIIRDNKRMINDFKNIQVSYAAKGASIAYMSTTGTCFEKSKVFLDKLMDVWIQNGLDHKNSIANNTISFIDQQLYGLGDTLGRMGAKLQRFRTSNKVVMPTVQVEAGYSRLQEIDSQALKLQMQASFFERLKGYLNKREDYNNLISPASVGLEHSVLNEYITQLAKVRSSLFQYKGKEKLNNPILEKLERQEATILATLYENINSQQEYIGHQQSVIAKQKARISREQNLLPGKEQQFMNIKRNFDLTNNLYTMLLEKRVEAQIQKASNLPDNEIIEQAYFEDIIEPKTNRIFQIGVLLGLILPALLILLKEFFNNKIQTDEDVEEITSVPIVGHIALSKKEGDVLTQKFPRSPITEAFRSLRTRLDYFKKAGEKQIILVTSSMSGEGKTFCAVNMAGILALAGRKTIVLGFDLRKPQLGKYMGLSEKLGLTTYLIGNNTIDEVIQSTQYKNLDCIVSGPIPPNPAELVDSKATHDLFEELEKRYDCIIIDTSPMGIVTDAFLLTPYSTTNIFVVRNQYTNKQYLKQNMRMLSDANIQNVGLVMNGLKTQKYGYGYGYVSND